MISEHLLIELLYKFYDNEFLIWATVCKYWHKYLKKKMQSTTNVRHVYKSLRIFLWSKIEHKSSFINAVKYNNFSILMWSQLNGLDVQTILKKPYVKIMSIDMFNWFLDNDYPYGEYTYVYLVKLNQFKTIIKLLDYGIQMPPNLINIAAKNDTVDMLIFLRGLGCVWNVTTSAIAAGNHNIEMLKWIHSNGCEWNSDTLLNAIRTNNTAAINYAVSNGCNLPSDNHIDSENINVDIMKQLQSLGLRVTSYTWWTAADSENIDVLKYLKTQNCPTWPLYRINKIRNIDTIYWVAVNSSKHATLFDLAAETGSIELIQNMLLLGYTWKSTTTAHIAGSGNLNTLRWAIENFKSLSPYTYLYAAKNGKLNIMKWMLLHKIYGDEQSTIEAAKMQHNNIVKWLITNHFHIDSRMIYVLITNENIELLNWVDQRRDIYISKNVAMAALETQNVEVINWVSKKHTWLQRDANYCIDKNLFISFKWLVENSCDYNTYKIKSCNNNFIKSWARARE